MNKKQYLLYKLLLVSGYLHASNAFNNDATYYLDKVDDNTPIGYHTQQDDLDVAVINSPLQQAVIQGNFNQVKELLNSKNANYSNNEIANALLKAAQKDYNQILFLLTQYKINMQQQ